MGWRIGSILIPNLWGNDGLDNSNEAMVFQNTQMMNLKKEIFETILPFKLSIFNINKYSGSLMSIYLFLWIIFLLFSFFFVYSKEKGLRADFILRRVSNITHYSPNIKNPIKKNENTEDQQIIKNNLKKRKKDTECNNSEDKNINNLEVNIDLNEIESTIGDSLDLDEMGSVLDGKTVKSFISDSTFKNNKNEIIDSVKKMIPKSYTKSEISSTDKDISMM